MDPSHTHTPDLFPSCSHTHLIYSTLIINPHLYSPFLIQTSVDDDLTFQLLSKHFSTWSFVLQHYMPRGKNAYLCKGPWARYIAVKGLFRYSPWMAPTETIPAYRYRVYAHVSQRFMKEITSRIIIYWLCLKDICTCIWAKCSARLQTWSVFRVGF